MTTNARARDPQRIEADLDRTRARVDDTLDKLQQKFSPGELFDQAFSYMRSKSDGETAANFKQTLTRNPLPVALVGLGLAWLMISGRRGSIPSDRAVHLQDYEQDQQGAEPLGVHAGVHDEFGGSTSSDRIEGLETASPNSSERGGVGFGASGSIDEAAAHLNQSSPATSGSVRTATRDGESISSGRSDSVTDDSSEQRPAANQTGSTTSGVRSNIKEVGAERLDRRTI